MLVISSDDDLADHSPLEFVSMTNINAQYILNLLGDYRYLRIGYYVSLHAELLNVPVFPSIKDILDIYRTPLFLKRAESVGIPTVPYTLVTDTPPEIVLPCVLIAVNPFTTNSIRVAKSKASVVRNISELGYDGRYAVCVQPLLGKIHQVEMILGHTRDSTMASAAKQVFEEFKIPLGNLVVQQRDEINYVSHFLPALVNGNNSQWVKDVLIDWREADPE